MHEYPYHSRKTRPEISSMVTDPILIRNSRFFSESNRRLTKTNVEEFEAPDYVLAQLNAVSGEASVSTGLKFGFEKVEGSDSPVLVIKGTFNGLGPAALASKAE